MRFLFPLWLICLLPQLALAQADALQAPESISHGFAALAREKASRSDALKKVESQLVLHIRQARGDADALALPVPQAVAGLPVVSEAGTVRVDIKAEVSPLLLDAISVASGRIHAQSAENGLIGAELPLAQIESIAGRPDVKSISISQGLIHNQQASVTADDIARSGVIAHAVDVARRRFGVSGKGVRIGVISDSVNSATVDYLAEAQAAGLLPEVDVIDPGVGVGEGTAMLEIVHAIAPEARLSFAPAGIGSTELVAAIEALVANNVDIIVDDITQVAAPPYQLDEVGIAAQDASEQGIFYFTSAGNTGNYVSGSSVNYEADFTPGDGPVLEPPYQDLHLFLPDVPGSWYNEALAGGVVCLFWSDPLGASTNDYDLGIFDSGLNLVGGSNTIQDGTNDPLECANVEAGQRIVVVRNPGAERRMIHIAISNFSARPGLAVITRGGIRGHQISDSVFAVASTSAFGADAPFDETDLVEPGSTDGFRRMFYAPDGTPFTPGDFLSTGGIVRQKPDVTAADGVFTTVFPQFFGTSAAAPHAGGIAALALEANPKITLEQMRSLFASTAIDIEEPGVDPTSGVGIIMAPALLEALLGARTVNMMGGVFAFVLAGALAHIVARRRRPKGIPH